MPESTSVFIPYMRVLDETSLDTVFCPECQNFVPAKYGILLTHPTHKHLRDICWGSGKDVSKAKDNARP